jgi:hypothetical protein
MSTSVQEQMEEARRALPTPTNADATRQVGGYLIRTIGLWIMLIVMFVVFFHIFNRP